MGGLEAARVAIPFVWMGAVLGISFLETPLKFRAPGITTGLALGIGRLVFRALNVVEAGFVVALIVLALVGGAGPAWVGPAGGGLRSGVVVLGALAVLLLCQIVVVRPRLERRTRDVLAGVQGPRSRAHLAYVLLEVIKILLLPTLGVLQLVAVAG